MARFIDDYLLYLLAKSSSRASAGFHGQLAEIGVPVPDKTLVQTGAPNLPREAIIFDDEHGLTRYLGDENPGPANRIEATRRVAVGLNRPVFLRAPDPILARPNRQVTLYQID